MLCAGGKKLWKCKKHGTGFSLSRPRMLKQIKRRIEDWKGCLENCKKEKVWVRRANLWSPTKYRKEKGEELNDKEFALENENFVYFNFYYLYNLSGR